MNRQKKLLSIYDSFPFLEHPLWQGILKHEFNLPQIIEAEKQHYLRTKAGQLLRKQSATNAPPSGPAIFQAALQNYLEEVAPDKQYPSHLDLIKRLILIGGVSEAELEETTPTPGNAAAMALYKDIATRGSAFHLIGAGAVEHYYSKLSPKIFEVYTTYYRMTPEQAETYALHGSMDATHAKRALGVLEEALKLHEWSLIELSVRDAFVATSLHYDGMLQAALDKITYWNGGV